MVGPDAISTDLAMGAERQTIWIDPLASLRIDEDTAEMREERDDFLRCIRHIRGRPR
jgi:hypothetical protein